MNSKVSFLLILASVVLFLNGCVTASLGYAKSEPLKKYMNVPATEKYDVTYSVEYFADMPDDYIGPRTQIKLSEKIRDTLVETGLFRRVTQTTWEGRSAYHYRFTIHFAMGQSVEDRSSLAILEGCFLFVIPVWMTDGYDFSAVAYLNGNYLTGSSATELGRTFYWLPLLPAGLVWNDWFAWHRIEDKCIRKVINDLTEYHCETFVSQKK